MKRKALLLWLCIAVVLTALPVRAAEYQENSDATSLLLMEASSGTVLYEKNADEALPPASVTKIMTVLLVLEAIDAGKVKLDDTVTVSTYAASMGGSQVYLKEGEVMRVEDLLKSVIIASANDAAVALAEHILGSEEAFVARMNERAQELGMAHTTFMNTNGLDDSDQGHLTSARDIAIMTRETLRHPLIFQYTTIWMDTIRDGAFGLTNTNRLIRFYKGANGLKTGSTAKAGFCISATAKRENMQLIAVVMGSSSRDNRNAAAASMLDFGFANYAVTSFDGTTITDIPICAGTSATVCGSYESFSALVEKGKEKEVEMQITYQPELCAPIHIGDTIGCVRYLLAEEEIGSVPIIATQEIPKIGYLHILTELLRGMLLFS